MKTHPFLHKRYPPYLPLKLSIRFQERRGKAKVYGEVNDQKKVIFIHVPKAAGSSVGQLVLGTDKVGHFPYYIYQHLDRKKFQEYFKFTVVRHPVARCYSAYCYLLGGGKGLGDRRLGDRIRSDTSNFSDFVRNHLVRYAGRFAHFVPQSEFLCDGDTIMVDVVFKLEELEELNNYKSILGFKDDIPRINASSKEPEEISGEVREIIESVYAEDYRHFNYSPGTLA